MSTVRTIEVDEAYARRIAECLAALYQSLGQISHSATNDAAVIALHEFSRVCGELQFRFDELGPRRANTSYPPILAEPSISTVLERAFEVDSSGAVVLFAVATEVIPRVLVTLRDAAATTSGAGPLMLRCSDAQGQLVRAMYALSSVLSGLALPENFEEMAPSFSRELDNKGFAEKF